MRKIIYSKIGLIFFALLLSTFFISPVFASEPFTKEVTFEGGIPGHRAWTYNEPGDGFPGSTGCYTTYTDERVHSGDMACKMIHYENDPYTGEWTDDFDECMGVIGFGNQQPYPDPHWLREGSEVWFRFYFYFESPWSWSQQFAQGSAIKMARITACHLDGSPTSANGQLSIYGGVNASWPGEIQLDNEPDPVDPDTCHTGVYFDMDAWQCIEYYVKISTDPNVARWRIWKNGILIREMPRDEQHKYKTLLDSNHCYMSTFIMSNWNGCVPLTQTQFVDDIIVTSDPNYPFKYDAQGNPMIGPIGWVNPGDEPVYTGTATLTLTPSTIVQHSPDPVIMTAVFENTSENAGNFELSVDIYKDGVKKKDDFKTTTAEVAAGSSITRNVAFLASAAAGDYLFVLEVKPVGQPDVIVVSAEALLTLINP